MSDFSEVLSSDNSIKGAESSALTAGDIVFTDRLLYKHYGVYVGNGQIVHFAGDKKHEISATHAFIQMTSVDDFRKGENIYIETCASQAFDYEQTVNRALSMVGKGRGEYNLIFNNCEHFAYWCKYGEKQSKQVRTVATLAVGAGVFIGAKIITKIAEGIDDLTYEI